LILDASNLPQPRGVPAGVALHMNDMLAISQAIEQNPPQLKTTDRSYE